jgi:hypothetical protein
MVGADAKYMPAVRIEFKGKRQSDYFSLKKFAEEDFNTTQTALARLIICDKLKEMREKKKEGKPIATQQMVMILAAEREKAAKRPKKKEIE